MAQSIVTFDTEHSGTIHDSQLDYYGKRLATGSSDHGIRVWDVSSEKPQWLAELKGHEGPVWQVCWAHPKYGSVLASCSYDKKAIVWREVRTGEWQQIYRFEDHSGSVNGVAFAPWEFGLHLAVVSSDGSVSVHTHMPDNTWSRKKFQAHANGVTSVSWMPAASAVALSSGPGSQQRTTMHRQIVTGGCDNQVRIWSMDETSGEWHEAHQMTDGSHTDWVRDVAWRPNVGVPTNVIASGSEDGTVILWTQETESATWKNSYVLNFNAPVWRVSWSITGTVLAVASANSHVSLYKETLDGAWEKVTSLMDSSEPATPEQAREVTSSDPFRRDTSSGEAQQSGDQPAFEVNPVPGGYPPAGVPPQSGLPQHPGYQSAPEHVGQPMMPVSQLGQLPAGQQHVYHPQIPVPQGIQHNMQR